MSDSAISVEGLSKSYLVGHQAAQAERYTALRDVISRNTRMLFRKTRDLLRGRSIVEGDEVEEFWALKDISFEVKRGEVLGIIGRNGAGKSTLLKILSRITEPTKGRVRIAGRVASLLEVGTGFHPELTGRENIFLNGAILGMTRAEIRRKFDEIVAFAEVERFLDTPVKRYSSGMYMRLAFAVAAHLEPEVLLVDEVLAVGDAKFQQKCLGKIKEIGREGRTILFVSHNMSAVRSLCESAIVLDGGRILLQSSMIEAIDRFLSDCLDSQGYDFDLDQRARAGERGTQLRFLRLRLNRGEGIWHGKPLEVEISFECHADVEKVSFGIGFRNRHGARILSLDSDVPGERINLRRGEKGIAFFALPELFLEPDQYGLDVGARSGDNFGLEYFERMETVFVAPSEKTPSVIAVRPGESGGFRQPTEWSFAISSGSGMLDSLAR